MPSYRCSMCALDFPQMKAYEICPKCEEPTSPVSNIKAMPKKEAKHIKLYADFEKFYEKHDKASDPERLNLTAAINPKHQRLLELV